MTNRAVAKAMEKHFGVKPNYETDPKKADHTGHKKGVKDDGQDAKAD